MYEGVGVSHLVVTSSWSLSTPRCRPFAKVVQVPSQPRYLVVNSPLPFPFPISHVPFSFHGDVIPGCSRCPSGWAFFVSDPFHDQEGGPRRGPAASPLFFLLCVIIRDRALNIMLSGGGDSSTSLWRLKSRNVAKVPISIEGRKTLADAEMTVELERFAEVQKESVGYLGV